MYTLFRYFLGYGLLIACVIGLLVGMGLARPYDREDESDDRSYRRPSQDEPYGREREPIIHYFDMERGLTYAVPYNNHSYRVMPIDPPVDQPTMSVFPPLPSTGQQPSSHLRRTP